MAMRSAASRKATFQAESRQVADRIIGRQEAKILCEAFLFRTIGERGVLPIGRSESL